MREKPVEEHLRNRVKAAGGRCLKLHPAGAVGIPDRLVLHQGRMWFVETKRPRGGVLSRAQLAWHTWLRDNGFQVEVLKSREQVDEWADERVVHTKS